MKADFNYDEFPGRFAHCLNEKCVRRDTCLRHQVWLRVPQTRGGVYIINPATFASHRRRVSFLPARPTAAVRQRHNLPVR